MKSTSVYQCPSEQTNPDSNPGSFGYCDYFYNANFSSPKGGLEKTRLDAPNLTILNGDAASFAANSSSDGGTHSQAGYSTMMPNVALEQGQWNPAVSGLRHLDGGNYGFADGHVKWLRAEKVTRDSTAKGTATFRTTDRTS